MTNSSFRRRQFHLDWTPATYRAKDGHAPRCPRDHECETRPNAEVHPATRQSRDPRRRPEPPASRVRGVGYLRICRAFLKLDPVARG